MVIDDPAFSLQLTAFGAAVTVGDGQQQGRLMRCGVLVYTESNCCDRGYRMKYVDSILSTEFARLFVLVIFSFVLAFMVLNERPVDTFVGNMLGVAVGFFFGRKNGKPPVDQ